MARLNSFAVGVRGDTLVIGRLRVELTREEARDLATWLAVLAFPSVVDALAAIDDAANT